MENKKTLEITGCLVYPITIGRAAFISEDDGLRKTSSVISMEKTSRNDVRFETLNTHYILHLKEGGPLIERN